MMEAGRKIRGFLGLSCCLGVLAAVSTANAQEVIGPAKDKAASQIAPETRLSSGELSTSQSSPADKFQAVGNTRFVMSGPNCQGCNEAFFDDAQIGIQGFGTQECNDGLWLGTAKPMFATLFNTLRIQLNTNRAGGDIYIMGNVPGDCQPDINNIIATFCCGLDGLEPRVEHEINLGGLLAGDLEDATWVVLVGRTGLAAQDSDGVFTGGVFPGHQNARDPDALGGTAPGRYFFNLTQTGNPGDWGDADGFGLGHCYDLNLELNFPPPTTVMPDCAGSPTGACCFADGTCETTEGFECGGLGGVYLGDGTVCGEDECPVCGNGVRELGEGCDGEDAELCFQGLCREDCDCLCPTPLEGAPENDCCFDKLHIGEGDFPFDTTLAQTDGLPVPPDTCNDFGSNDVYNDVWYNFEAECNGTLLVSTCEDTGGSAEYDTDIAVYVGCDTCPPTNEQLVGCNDDAIDLPCGGEVAPGNCCHSNVEIPVEGGNCYKIRVGGWGANDAGTGVLHVALRCEGDAVEESLHIKQGSNPAPVNPSSGGVIPMVLAGSATLDVNTIDRSTLRLGLCGGPGVIAPLDGHYHVSSGLNHPAGPVECGGCSKNANQSSDGIDDLAMKFRTDETLAALNIGVGDGVVTVELTGTSGDGDFFARDCILVVPPGVGDATLTLGANVGDTYIEIKPLDINVDSDGFTNFSRGYITGTNVTLTAPVTSEGRKFVRWSVNGVLQPVGRRTLQITTGADTNLKAIYGHGARLDVDRPTSDDGDVD